MTGTDGLDITESFFDEVRAGYREFTVLGDIKGCASSEAVVGDVGAD